MTSPSRPEQPRKLDLSQQQRDRVNDELRHDLDARIGYDPMTEQPEQPTLDQLWDSMGHDVAAIGWRQAVAFWRHPIQQAIESQAAAPEQDEAVRADEAALSLVHRLSEPRMKAWLSSHVTGMHWGCGVTEDEGDCMVAQLAALASPPPVPAAPRIVENAYPSQVIGGVPRFDAHVEPPVPAALREVWTVNYGNYSPAEVVAVYATREAAEADADNRDGLYEVGRWEVEGPPPELDVEAIEEALMVADRFAPPKGPARERVIAAQKELARLSHQSEDQT